MDNNFNNIIYRIDIGFADSLDPATAVHTACREIIDNVYEKLFNYNGYNIEPVLVENWTLLDDNF